MPKLLITRPIHPLPGRQKEALDWLRETEAVRKEAGQIDQFVLRSIVDTNEYQLVQVWTDRAAYQRWRETPERSRLSRERQHYLTHDPARLYEIMS